MQPFDTTLWVNCMLDESVTAPPLFPGRFGDLCDDVLCDMGLSLDDITHANCRDVYLKLVDSVLTLIRNGLFWM